MCIVASSPENTVISAIDRFDYRAMDLCSHETSVSSIVVVIITIAIFGVTFWHPAANSISAGNIRWNIFTFLNFREHQLNWSHVPTYFYFGGSILRTPYLNPALANNELILMEKGLLFVEHPCQYLVQSTGCRKNPRVIEPGRRRYFCYRLLYTTLPIRNQ